MKNAALRFTLTGLYLPATLILIMFVFLLILYKYRGKIVVQNDRVFKLTF